MAEYTMINRNGEDDRTYFRSDRFYSIDNKYFFSTREGDEVGPFDSKGDAELALERYIDCMESRGGNHIKAKKIALQGSWATTHYQ